MTIETGVSYVFSLVLAPEDSSYLTNLSLKDSMPIRDEDGYPTTYTPSLPYSYSYYQPITTIFISPFITLTTIVISQTVTTSLTTTELVTSKSTITTLAPTAAPLLQTTSTNNQLSSGAIAGIVLGSIVGLLLIILILYMFLMRSKWKEWFCGGQHAGPKPTARPRPDSMLITPEQRRYELKEFKVQDDISSNQTASYRI
ncbi:hypothetical protein F5Y03DRAFT_350493 [Xylaria venustula]|nr:hypothetical protein F5Y03DRAFT_350493 [Xylaria venustula]